MYNRLILITGCLLFIATTGNSQEWFGQTVSTGNCAGGQCLIAPSQVAVPVASPKVVYRVAYRSPSASVGSCSGGPVRRFVGNARPVRRLLRWRPFGVCR